MRAFDAGRNVSGKETYLICFLWFRSPSDARSIFYILRRISSG